MFRVRGRSFNSAQWGREYFPISEGGSDPVDGTLVNENPYIRCKGESLSRSISGLVSFTKRETRLVLANWHIDGDIKSLRKQRGYQRDVRGRAWMIFSINSISLTTAFYKNIVAWIECRTKKGSRMRRGKYYRFCAITREQKRPRESQVYQRSRAIDRYISRAKVTRISITNVRKKTRMW